MHIYETTLPGVLLVEPVVFRDPRGYFVETYHAQKYAEAGLGATFVQDNFSHSSRGTLRGLHYQLTKPQGKLLTVLSGAIFDVAVDIRKGSPTFGQWVGVELSQESHRQLYIPPGFAHGFCVISETAGVLYKCTDLYAPEDERGVLWNDPALNIAWPIDQPVLSKKDSAFASLRDMESDLPLYRP